MECGNYGIWKIIWIEKEATQEACEASYNPQF